MQAEDDESLVELFWAVARRLRHAARDTLAPWDITPSQGRAVAVLARHGEMRLSALADHLRIAPRSTTEVIDSLEARELVFRRPDPGDRRATLVGLSPRGEKVMRDIRTTRHNEAARLFAQLSAADRRHLTRILRQLRADWQ